MKVVALFAVIAACMVASTTATVAIARCWVGADIGWLTLTQNDYGMTTTVTGSLLFANNLNETIYAHFRANAVGAQSCLPGLDAPIFTVVGNNVSETVTATTPASLSGAISLVGRVISFTTSSASCAAATTLTARCVIGIAMENGPVGGANTTLPTPPLAVVAQLVSGVGYPNVGGTVTFVPNFANGEVLIHVEAYGLAPGSTHGIHVHWYGDMSLENGVSMGGHLNPYNYNHGASPSLWRHAGDIGNVVANVDGDVDFIGSFNSLSLVGYGNIIGRGVILHQLADDFNPLNLTNSTGAAGLRWARGVIGLSDSRPAALTPAIATCSFTYGTTPVGTITLTQLSATSPVLLYGGFAGVPDGIYSIHALTNGDLKAGQQGACFAGETAVATVTATSASPITSLYGKSSSTINLFPSGTSTPNIIGRSLGVFAGAAACSASPVATLFSACVVGISGAGANVNNKAYTSISTAPTSAVCKIEQSSTYVSVGGSSLSGEVMFTTSTVAGELQLTARISGLVASSVHAMHVHWFGDMSDTTAVIMGGHLNPLGFNHGRNPSYWRHMGDIGNLAATAADGVITHSASVNLLTFFGYPSIIGRGIVFHELVDDYNPSNTSSSVGAAGLRWGRCVIGISARSSLIESSTAGSDTASQGSTATEASTATTTTSSTSTTRSSSTAAGSTATTTTSTGTGTGNSDLGAASATTTVSGFVAALVGLVALLLL